MERWVWPSLVLTLAMGGVSLAVMPLVDMANRPGFFMFKMWMLMMGILTLAMFLCAVIRAMVQGVDQPVVHFREKFDVDRAMAAFIGCLVGGLNLAMFGWMKPLLQQIVPFRADPFLANLDAAIFFGQDPWLLLQWFDHPFADILYHQAWFGWLAVIFLAVLCRKPSREKTILIVTYMALWAVLAPVIHLSIPAAGPLFFDEFGFGDRFIALTQPDYAAQLANYLWEGYTERTYTPGGGISAMPSMHIATMAWTIIATYKTRWFWPAALVSLYMWIGSVWLGWHYVSDGLVGALGAWLIYSLIKISPLWRRDARPFVDKFSSEVEPQEAVL